MVTSTEKLHEAPVSEAPPSNWRLAAISRIFTWARGQGRGCEERLGLKNNSPHKPDAPHSRFAAQRG